MSTPIERGAEALEPWVGGDQWSDFSPQEWREARTSATRAVFESIDVDELAGAMAQVSNYPGNMVPLATAIKAHLLSGDVKS